MRILVAGDIAVNAPSLRDIVGRGGHEVDRDPDGPGSHGGTARRALTPGGPGCMLNAIHEPSRTPKLVEGALDGV